MLVAGVSLMMVAAPLSAITFTFANPFIARDFGIGSAEVMLAFSVMTLANALSMVWMGRWIAHWGARRVVIVGAAWSALMLVGFSFASNLWQLILLSLGLGLTVATSTALSGTILISEWFVSRRGTVLGFVNAFTGVTGLVAGLLLPWVIDSFGWPGAYRVVAALLFCLTVLPAVLLVRSRPDSAGVRPFGAVLVPEDLAPLDGVSFREALRGVPFWVITGCVVLTAAVQSLLQHLAPLARLAGLSLTELGVAMAIQSLVFVLVQAFVGFAVDNVGLVTTLVTCLGTQLLGCVAFLFITGATAFTLSLILFVNGLCVTTILVPIIVRQVFGPEHYAAILGPLMGAMPAGLSLGAPLWGLTIDLTGDYRVGLIVAAACSALVAFALTWVIRRAAVSGAESVPSAP